MRVKRGAAQMNRSHYRTDSYALEDSERPWRWDRDPIAGERADRLSVRFSRCLRPGSGADADGAGRRRFRSCRSRNVRRGGGVTRPRTATAVLTEGMDAPKRPGAAEPGASRRAVFGKPGRDGASGALPRAQRAQAAPEALYRRSRRAEGALRGAAGALTGVEDALPGVEPAFSRRDRAGETPYRPTKEGDVSGLARCTIPETCPKKMQTIRFASRWPMRALEYAGAALAMLGTFLMASGVLRHGTAFAWAVWLVGSALFCAWAVKRQAWGVLAMNIVYMGFDTFGLARALGLL